MILQSNLKFNGNTKFDFNGGNLTSDGGLLLIHEFAENIGFNSFLSKRFNIEADQKVRIHPNDKLLKETIYLNALGYHHQDDADALRNDPGFESCFNHQALASQPTHSRFAKRLTEGTEKQLEGANLSMTHAYFKEHLSDSMLLDLDTTHFMAYGTQEGNAFNNHYRETGMCGLLLFEGESGLALKGTIRPGNYYCSKEAADFLEPVLKGLQRKFSSVCRLLRCDSGFASPEIYETCEKTGTNYVIRLKENAVLVRLAEEFRQDICDPFDIQNEASIQGEFYYQAKSWSRERRVVVEINRPAGEMCCDYIFIVTNLETDRIDLVFSLYRKRGAMENYIKEAKNGFRFDKVSHSKLVTNRNLLQMKLLSYNLMRLFTLSVLPDKFKKHQIETLRNKLFKVAAKRVKSGRQYKFRFTSSFPYKKEFIEILESCFIQKMKL